MPFAAGGTTDVMARIVAERLGARLGRPVIIENVAGAGGNNGATLVSKARADGYTILMATPGQAAMNQFMYRRMPYDTATAFVPLAYIASVPSVLVISPALDVSSTTDFLAKMKARPGGANFGSAGMGSTGHLGGALLSMQTGLNAQHVPYRGSAPMLQDLLAGNIQFTIDTVPGVMSFITSGTIKALAVTGKSRSPALPDVPNNTEAGIPDVEMASWLVLLAPAGTPQPISGSAQCRDECRSEGTGNTRQDSETGRRARRGFSAGCRRTPPWGDCEVEARHRDGRHQDRLR